jgi:flagellar hook-basal body complex protein FliE
MSAILPAAAAAPLLPPAVPESGAPAGSDRAFAAQLDRAVGAVDTTVTDADQALFNLASGTEVDLHGAMIALEEAEIALRAMVSVRDKVISAYESLLNLAI